MQRKAECYSIKCSLLQPTVSQTGSKQVHRMQYIALKREKGNTMRYPEAQSDGNSHAPQPQNVPVQSTQADESPSVAADGFNAD